MEKRNLFVDYGPLTFFPLNYVELNNGDGNSNIFEKVFICNPRFL